MTLRCKRQEINQNKIHKSATYMHHAVSLYSTTEEAESSCIHNYHKIAHVAIIKFITSQHKVNLHV